MAQTSVQSYRGQLQSGKIVLDPIFGHLANIFANISRCRREGPARLSWSDIRDWVLLYRVPLSDWELDYIVALDDEFMRYVEGLRNKSIVENTESMPKFTRRHRKNFIKGRVLE